MNIYFITSNKHKLAEAHAKFSTANIIIEHLELDYHELQADTNEEIMKFGVKWIIDTHRSDIDKPFFIEDSGLFVHALNGFPGVYSKYIFKTIGPQGIIELMLNNTELEARVAHFEACIGYFDPQKANETDQLLVFKGKCEGTLATELRGMQGFGFDPIFIPKGSDQTFAEMQTATKNLYSHRSIALDKLIEYIKKSQKP